MAGHSHWAGIKHKKAVIDAKRGKLFSKLAKAIIVAAKNGGGDPVTNLSLKYAIDKAKAGNMTKDAIDRAIKKGAGELDGASYDALMYEGYGPGGAALLVEILTDNRNRTASELRKIFEKRGATLAEPGAVAWQFQQRGQLMVPAEGTDEDALMEVALEAGAEDIRRVGEYHEVLCDPKVLESVRSVLEGHAYRIEQAEVTMIPTTSLALEAAAARRLVDFFEILEDHEDVQRVHSIAEFSALDENADQA
jgi:YebC/PmpR family DNA-binding regulatory protein